MPTMTMSKEGFNMRKQRVEKKQGSDDISIHLKKNISVLHLKSYDKAI